MQPSWEEFQQDKELPSDVEKGGLIYLTYPSVYFRIRIRKLTQGHLFNLLNKYLN